MPQVTGLIPVTIHYLTEANNKEIKHMILKADEFHLLAPFIHDRMARIPNRADFNTILLSHNEVALREEQDVVVPLLKRFVVKNKFPLSVFISLTNKVSCFMHSHSYYHIHITCNH